MRIELAPENQDADKLLPESKDDDEKAFSPIHMVTRPKESKQTRFWWRKNR